MARACNSSYSGGWGRRTAWAQEFEATVNYVCTTALQPGWQSKTLSQKRKRKKESLENTILDIHPGKEFMMKTPKAIAKTKKNLPVGRN